MRLCIASSPGDAAVRHAARLDGEVAKRFAFGEPRDKPRRPVAATGPGVVAVPVPNGNLLTGGLRLATRGRSLLVQLLLLSAHLAEQVIARDAVVCDGLLDAHDDARGLLLPKRIRFGLQFLDQQLNLCVALGQRNLPKMATCLPNFDNHRSAS